MTEAAFNQLQKEGKVKVLQKPEIADPQPLGIRPFSADEYQPILEMLRRVKKHRTVSSAPSFFPKDFLESIQPFDNGTTQGFRMYIHQNWYKFTGTII